MLQAHPEPAQHVNALVEALEALAVCEQVCVVCADACLAEKSPDKLRTCIHLNLECAEICSATARLLLRQTESAGTAVHEQLHACSVACQACGNVCSSHGSHHESCALCADTCRLCQEKCNFLIEEFSAVGAIAQD